MALADDIETALAYGGNDSLVLSDFRKRYGQGFLTRDENPASHFCVYFLPFNSVEGKVFLVAHKKSGLWLSPGGHIDRGETLLQTLNREIHEELGTRNHFSTLPVPFMISTVEINRQSYDCKKHYDIWFVLETDGATFRVNPEEFHETRWVTCDEALALLTDPSNIQAIQKLMRNG